MAGPAGKLPTLELYSTLLRTAVHNESILEQSVDGMNLAAAAYFTCAHAPCRHTALPSLRNACAARNVMTETPSAVDVDGLWRLLRVACVRPNFCLSRWRHGTAPFQTGPPLISAASHNLADYCVALRCLSMVASSYACQ